MYTFIVFALALALSIIFSGLIIYKTGNAPTWEAGVKTLFQWAYKAISKFIDWLWANSDTARQQDLGRFLSEGEKADLSDSLDGHPYESVSVEDVGVDSNDVYSVRVEAVGLAGHYAGITPKQAHQISQNAVTNFFRKHREYVPPFYISGIHKTGFMLYLPLSDYGKQTLARKIEEEAAMRALNQARASAVVTPLTEAVPEDDSEAQK